MSNSYVGRLALRRASLAPIRLPAVAPIRLPAVAQGKPVIASFEYSKELRVGGVQDNVHASNADGNGVRRSGHDGQAAPRRRSL